MKYLDGDGFDDGGTPAWRANRATWQAPANPARQAAIGVCALLFIRCLGRLAWALGALIPWLVLIPALIALALWDAILGR
jgi:hypothetical protein